jgi:DNA phosphorothioation-dependent restriction protein DptG
MTQVLQQALESLNALPEAQQNEIAQRLLEEIEEAKWQASFDRPESKDFLQTMAEKVRAERRAGQTKSIECE